MPEPDDEQEFGNVLAGAPPPRRVLLVSLLRSLLSVVVVVTMFFTLPLRHPAESWSIVAILAGIVLVGVVLTVQVRAILSSPYPLMRAVEALCITGPLFIVLFAVLHYEIGSVQPGSYSESMTRLDALYFTVTTFATVGYGDISPVSQPARSAALVQMVLGLILVGIVARVIAGAAQLGRQRRQGRPSASGESR